MLHSKQWPNHFPHATASYLLSFPFPSAPSLSSETLPRAFKTLSDIYTGIDVWGRGSHGGGGFGTYRALEHISPQELGLSAAVFGQAWTWESEQDKPGFTWNVWWAYEQSLWLGLSKDDVELPEMKHRKGETLCDHGSFRPITEFFTRRPVPDPVLVPFCTMFSPGVGYAWWVQGREVMRQENGWTDVGMQGSLGDALWPVPKVVWEGDEGTRMPRATVKVEMGDAWIGGSCVAVALEDDESAVTREKVGGQEAEDDDEAAMFRCVWVPVQAVSVSPGIPYTAVLVYKIADIDGIDLDIGLSAKASSNSVEGEGKKLEVDVVSLGVEDFGNGWTELRIQILYKAPWDTASPAESSSPSQAIDLGMIIGIAMEDPTTRLDVQISLGMLAMHPSLVLENVVQIWPKVLWAHFEAPAPVTSTSTSVASTTLEKAHDCVGTLTWDTGVAFSALTPSAIPPINSPEDTVLAWTLPDDQGHVWFPAFLYFNVYAAPIFAAGVPVPEPEGANFVGTTGLAGLEDSTRVEYGMMPEVEGKEGLKGWRWYVQGVTDRGEVLPWDRCAYADWMIKSD
jgi:mannosyl-glycoprotein endo-beta-N-acetylglucosaminidase